MALDLTGHFGHIEAAYAAALKAPLSARKVALVAVLLDHFAEEAFEAGRHGPPAGVFFAEDLPAFRAALRQQAPALGLIFDLAGLGPDGPRLATRAVKVPIAEYHTLPVEDFMVSLYNGHTVQRVVVVSADGTERLAHPVLGEAMAWWRPRTGAVAPA